jgi:hypothetical protein
MQIPEHFPVRQGNNDAGDYFIVIAATDGISGYAYDTLKISIKDFTITGIIGGKSRNDNLILNVYPNPAIDMITVKLNGNLSGNLTIMNSLGTMIISREISGLDSEISFDLSSLNLQPGIYLLNTTSGKKFSSWMIVKK